MLAYTHIPVNWQSYDHDANEEDDDYVDNGHNHDTADRRNDSQIGRESLDSVPFARPICQRNIIVLMTC